jgi:hypothetical protein
MSQRKVALVGTADGPWVSVRNMSPLSVKVDMPENTEVRVFVTRGDSREDEGKLAIITKSGEHPLMSGTWAKITVALGDPSAVLCTLYSRQEAECLTAK